MPSVADVMPVMLQVTAGDAATNGAFGDRLGGIQNLTGSNHKDTLTGDGNPNVLKGGGGNDTLAGAATTTSCMAETAVIPWMVVPAMTC